MPDPLPRLPHWRKVALLLALALAGCAPTISSARSTVDAAMRFYSVTAAAAQDQYSHERMSCLTAADGQAVECMDTAEGRWMPVEAALERLRLALVAAQASVGAAEAADALGRRGGAGEALMLAGRVVDASIELRAAVRAWTARPERGKVDGR